MSRKMSRIKLQLLIMGLLLIYLTISVYANFQSEGYPQKIARAYRNESLVRLHILANSDSAFDQYLKRQVRDYLLENFSGNNWLKDISNEQLLTMQNKLNSYINQLGVNYKIKVEQGVYKFPKRTYSKLTLPAGNYQAVKVIIGQAAGANWWCVLSPPVCFNDKKVGQKDIKVKSFLVNWLNDARDKSLLHNLAVGGSNYERVGIEISRRYRYQNWPKNWIY